jgi:glycosyltransferase involved in cell wall biosynthesis
MLDRLAPDICVLQVHRPLPYLETARDTDIQQVLFVRDCANPDWIGEAAVAEEVCLIANSRFIADWCSQLLGREVPYCYPAIEPSRYEASGNVTGKYVLFVNPVPGKGLKTALAVAGLCAEIPFLFVEGWPLQPEDKSRLMDKLSEYPNIRWRDTAFDMRTLYRQARILFAPSKWREAFCRVIVEAQISGIPAIASDIGGIPEAMGDGGILVAPDADPALWAEAIRRLWHDEEKYSRYRDKALLASERKCMSPEVLTERMEKFLQAILSSHRRSRYKSL